jgi:hypothetical protein
MPASATIGPARGKQARELSLHIPSLHCVEGKVNRNEESNHDPEHDEIVQHKRSSCRASKPRHHGSSLYMPG